MAAGTKTAADVQTLRNSYAYALALLVAQFLLGMAVNLFVKIPTNHPGSNPTEYFSGVAQSITWAIVQGPLWLTLHASLGLLLAVASIVTLYQGIRTRTRGLVLTSVFGMIGTIAAGFNGGSYLNYHEDFSSMLMSAGFAMAVASYGIGLYLAPRPATRTT